MAFTAAFEAATGGPKYQAELQALLSELTDQLKLHRGFYDPVARVEA